MANRVLVGNHPSFGYGLFVSKPTKNVLGSTHNDFAFKSNITDTQGDVVSANGKVFKVVDVQQHNVTFTANEKVKFVNHDYNRSLFSDGTTDRCPLVLVQTTVRGDTSIQNAMGFLFYSSSTSGRKTNQGFRYRHFPYYTTTQGRIQINIQAEGRAVYASGTENHYNMTGLSQGDWPGSDTSQRTIYVALCDLELR